MSKKQGFWSVQLQKIFLLVLLHSFDTKSYTNSVIPLSEVLLINSCSNIFMRIRIKKDLDSPYKMWRIRISGKKSSRSRLSPKESIKSINLHVKSTLKLICWDVCRWTCAVCTWWHVNGGMAAWSVPGNWPRMDPSHPVCVHFNSRRKTLQVIEFI